MPVVELFFALSTQWRVHPMTGTRLGIDYQAIEPAARLVGVDMTPARFADLQLMEGAALTALLA